MKNKPHKDLILASASPRRLDLLKQINVTPGAIVPADIDESEHAGELPKNLALRLALEKAEAVKNNHPQSYTLAADTVVACGRRILPKTETRDEALKCLELLSGRRHRVYGGIALHCPDGSTKSRLVTTMVQLKKLTPQEIAHYIESEEWTGKAGGYAIQGFASAFIKTISGSYSNVVGLSLYDTMQLLQSSGFYAPE